jgi:hypothetical protein
MNRIILALVLAAGLCSCDNARDAGSKTLDSVGTTLEKGLEKGADKVEEGIGTAVTSLKKGTREVEIEAVLGRIRGLEKVDVTVTDSSAVTLSGVVATEADKARAADIASSIKGVGQVTNNIAVGAIPDTTKRNADTTPRRDTAMKK